jgi:hypothetical protein
MLRCCSARRRTNLKKSMVACVINYKAWGGLLREFTGYEGRFGVRQCVAGRVVSDGARSWKASLGLVGFAWRQSAAITCAQPSPSIFALACTTAPEPLYTYHAKKRSSGRYMLFLYATKGTLSLSATNPKPTLCPKHLDHAHTTILYNTVSHNTITSSRSRSKSSTQCCSEHPPRASARHPRATSPRPCPSPSATSGATSPTPSHRQCR